MEILITNKGSVVVHSKQELARACEQAILAAASRRGLNPAFWSKFESAYKGDASIDEEAARLLSALQELDPGAVVDAVGTVGDNVPDMSALSKFLKS